MDTYVVLLVIIFCIIIAIFKPKIKGWFGEKSVSLILEQLNHEQYKVINNVMLKTERGFSQIDHLVVSIYGIFVIETKNYKGWITGTEFSEQWTKNVYGKKYNFRNPLLQNYGHVKELQKQLNLNENYFIPIVVFSVDSELKVKTEKPVVYTVNLNKEIRKYKEIKFTADEVKEISNKILNLNVDSKENRKDHVNQIKLDLNEKRNRLDQRICPKCGGTLVERKGKYGEFWGCSNYPKCKYTLKK